MPRRREIFSEWNYVCYFFFVSNKKFSIAQFFETCDCSELRIRTTFKNFTTSNTGLDKNNQFPELGSVFKAAFIKSASWWFAKTAIYCFWRTPRRPLSPKSLVVSLRFFPIKHWKNTYSSWKPGWDFKADRHDTLVPSCCYLRDGSCGYPFRSWRCQGVNTDIFLYHHWMFPKNAP